MSTHVPKFCTPGKVHVNRIAHTPPIARQLAIESTLTLSLWHIKKQEIHSATRHAVRAARLLKQSCAQATKGN